MSPNGGLNNVSRVKFLKFKVDDLKKVDEEWNLMFLAKYLIC